MLTVCLQDLPYVRFVYSTDWHLSATPPGKRTGNYAGEILDKIMFAGQVSKEKNAYSLCGGDVFHQKNPKASGNTFGLANYLINTIRNSHNHGQVWGTHGNHDLTADRMESIPDQPFGTICAAEVYNDISAVGSVLFMSQNDGSGINVQVDAFPYQTDDLAALKLILSAAPRDPRARYRVALLHQYGDPGDQGSMFGHPTIGFNQMADSDYDVALWGHDHSRTEPVTVGKCTHVRLGSLSRASLAEDEVDRPVNLAFLSFMDKGIGFKEIPVPVKPLKIAFTAAAAPVEKVHKTEEVTTFFKEMDDAVSSITSSDPWEVMRELSGEDRKVYNLAVELCGG